MSKRRLFSRWGASWQCMKCKQKRIRRYLKHGNLWCKVNRLSQYIEVQNLLTSIILIIEVSNKHHCELNKILRNFYFDKNLWFSVVFDKCMKHSRINSQIKVAFFFWYHYFVIAYWYENFCLRYRVFRVFKNNKNANFSENVNF